LGCANCRPSQSAIGTGKEVRSTKNSQAGQSRRNATEIHRGIKPRQRQRALSEAHAMGLLS